MAFDNYFADRLRQRLIEKKIIFDEKKMMGGLIFMVNDKMCVGIDIDKGTGEDRLMARIGKAAYDKVLKETVARKMDFTGKVMRGFVFIYPDGFDTDTQLNFWIEKALAFNAFLTTGQAGA